MFRLAYRLAPLLLVLLTPLVEESRRDPGMPSADDAEFKPLFNGKDLTGWLTPQDKALFTVEDGEIVGRTQGDLKKNQFLATEKPYRNFVLKAKVKIRNGNSGIQFRSKR